MLSALISWAKGRGENRSRRNVLTCRESLPKLFAYFMKNHSISSDVFRFFGYSFQSLTSFAIRFTETFSLKTFWPIFKIPQISCISWSNLTFFWNVLRQKQKSVCENMFSWYSRFSRWLFVT